MKRRIVSLLKNNLSFITTFIIIVEMICIYRVDTGSITSLLISLLAIMLSLMALQITKKEIL